MYEWRGRGEGGEVKKWMVEEREGRGEGGEGGGGVGEGVER